MAEFHETLNPVIWDRNKGTYDLKPEVKTKLQQIANAFIETIEMDKDAVRDIVITGSMASYNYTPHSDIDLHLLVDFEKVHKNCPIVGDYLLSKKSEFNQKHDIFIYDIPVEVYAESIDNENVHNGLYSLRSGWLDFPKKLKPTTNDAAVKAKYEEYKAAADGIKEGDLAEKLIEKIKKMRKAGLADGGEFSVENLVFKKLRDNGIIEKLMKVKKEEVDKKLSLGEEFIERLSESVSEGCYNDIVGLVEGIINELKDEVYRRGHDIAAAIAKEQEDNLANVKKAEDVEFVKDDIAKRRHQAAKMCDRRENQVIQRAAQEEAEAKAKKKKKRVDGSSEK